MIYFWEQEGIKASTHRWMFVLKIASPFLLRPTKWYCSRCGILGFSRDYDEYPDFSFSDCNLIIMYKALS